MQIHFMGLIFTNHAIQRLCQRKIAQSDAWYTFQHADKRVPGSAPGAFKFFKDYGEQRIEVVAKQNEKGEWVVLSCWSKFVGTGKPLFQKPENFLLFLTKKVLKSLWKKIQKRRKTELPAGQVPGSDFPSQESNRPSPFH